ncbi:MAG: CHAT domain-containing protein [Cyanobacteria bacterium J06626_4]
MSLLIKWLSLLTAAAVAIPASPRPAGAQVLAERARAPRALHNIATAHPQTSPSGPEASHAGYPTSSLRTRHWGQQPNWVSDLSQAEAGRLRSRQEALDLITASRPEEAVLAKTLPVKVAAPLTAAPKQQMTDYGNVIEDGDVILNVTGSLEKGDELLDDNTLYDRYTFEGEAGQAVVLTLTSADFDTYLILQNSAGENLFTNDDISDFDTDSAIVLVLPETGSYQVLANALYEGESGDYQLSIVPAQADDPTIQTSAANQLITQGERFVEQGNYAEAIAAYEQALALYQTIDNQSEAASTRYLIGIAYYEQNEYETGLEYFKQFVEFNQNSEPYSLLGSGWYFVGLGYSQMQAYEAAIAAHETAIATFDALPDTPELQEAKFIGRAVSSSGISDVYYQQGDKRNELFYIEQAIAALRELPPSPYFMTELNSLAILLGEVGRYEASLAAFTETITLSRELTDPDRELSAQVGMGQLQRTKGYFVEALTTFQVALLLAQEIEDSMQTLDESLILGEIANVYSDLDEYETSLDYYQRSFDQAEIEGNFNTQIAVLNNTSIVYNILGEYEQGLRTSQNALALSRDYQTDETDRDQVLSLGLEDQMLNLGLMFFEASALQGIGNTYENLGDYPQALDYYQQAVDIHVFLQTTIVGLDATAQKADALNGMGIVYLRMEEDAQALAIFEQALEIIEGLDLAAAEAAFLLNLGLAHDNLSQYDQALSAYEQSLAINRRIGSSNLEATSLNNLGVLNLNLEQFDQAIAYLEQSLVIRERIGDRVGKAGSFSNLGWAFENTDQPELAILFYKQAVNTFEEIRGSLQGLDPTLQKSYTDSIATSYRDLADLLLQEDRVLEAQRVLDLLKVQELNEYLNNVRGNAQTASGIEYWQPEAEILARYQDLQADAITLGSELVELNALKTAGGITPEEEARRLQLTELQKELTQQFNAFVDSDVVQSALDQLSRQELRQSLALEELSGLRDNLANLDAVLFYPLILEDRLELVITTPDQEPIHRTVEGVGRADINTAVQAFRQALGDPSADATGPAQQLYRWLVEPLEADLAAAGVDTILYSPDGSLRYVPLAALHDGDRWLVERFRVNNITAESLTEIDTAPQATPRVLAGAFADQSVAYSVRGQNYRGLWFAGQEVEQLADMLGNITPLFNDGFDLATVEAELGGANVLHFATHADFVPGDPEASFILFGNGDTLTLKGIEDLSLANIDMVVLSACETGLGGYDNSGEQILGLGYQFQRRGAKAVVASLWVVDDGGTQALMSAFYSALETGLSKAEALRQAQLAMLTGDFETLGGDRGGLGVVNTPAGEQLRAGAQLTHPYYWAPFILIGNGL